MADIFISYAREDREWVEKLANAFVAEGFSVWWDFDLLVGKRYRETIETELQTAKAAVVVWSQHSIRSDFVRDEAEDAQQRNILAPILKEVVRPPAGFRQLQTADLSNWTGSGEHVEYRRVMKGVSHLVGRQALGDTGVIHVDPAHPTTHFEEPKPVAPVPAPPMDVAPIVPVTPQPEPPPAMVAKAPEPVVAPAPVAPVPPPPPHATAPTAFVATPKPHNPIIMYVGIGAVALIAIIFVAMQFLGGKTPGKPAQLATPVAAPAVPAVTHPAGNTAPPATGGDTTGGDTGGDAGGDTGQSGPHGNSAPPAAEPPAPPADNGTQDGSANGDTGGDVGQGNPHN